MYKDHSTTRTQRINHPSPAGSQTDQLKGEAIFLPPPAGERTRQRQTSLFQCPNDGREIQSPTPTTALPHTLTTNTQPSLETMQVVCAVLLCKLISKQEPTTQIQTPNTHLHINITHKQYELPCLCIAFRGPLQRRQTFVLTSMKGQCCSVNVVYRNCCSALFSLTVIECYAAEMGFQCHSNGYNALQWALKV